MCVQAAPVLHLKGGSPKASTAAKTEVFSKLYCEMYLVLLHQEDCFYHFDTNWTQLLKSLILSLLKKIKSQTYDLENIILFLAVDFHPTLPVCSNGSDDRSVGGCNRFVQDAGRAPAVVSQSVFSPVHRAHLSRLPPVLCLILASCVSSSFMKRFVDAAKLNVESEFQVENYPKTCKN